MITKMTHTNLYVINQDSAYDFYTNKLGFKVVDDMPMGTDTRWLTVSPPEQPNLEIIIIPGYSWKNVPERNSRHNDRLDKKRKIWMWCF